MEADTTPTPQPAAEAFLRRAEAAEYLQAQYGLYTAATLAKLAVVGGGPPFRKLGQRPLYRPVDLDAWARARMSKVVHSTAELASP